LREARAVNRINHKNIVEITDCGEMDGVAYLVMEYIEGVTLHRELERGAFPWIRAAKVSLQIASALGRAHQMGVVHRDLNPTTCLSRGVLAKLSAVRLVGTACRLLKSSS
jgi:serine/threonine-protein kinase